jgi:hypothetical protein
MVKETNGRLVLFGGANNRLVMRGRKTEMVNVPTNYGTISANLEFESDHRCVVKIENAFFADSRPESLEVVLPFGSTKVAASSPNDILKIESNGDSTTIKCLSVIRTLFIDL